MLSGNLTGMSFQRKVAGVKEADDRAFLFRHRLGQLNVFIQPAMARPISSGKSSWTKWTPLTVTSVCAGKLRACSRTLPPARIRPAPP